MNFENFIKTSRGGRNFRICIMNDVELSNEETEKVLQFQELTGIDDINVCRDILRYEKLNRAEKHFLFARNKRRKKKFENDDKVKLNC